MKKCANCRSRKVSSRVLARYPYRESGLDDAILLNGVQETRCDDCGERYYLVQNEWQALQVLALALFAKVGHLTGREWRFLRGECLLTQEQLARRLGLRRESIAEREAKPDPGLSEGAEFLSRAVLLMAFRDHLSIAGEDHLSPVHHRRLRDLETRFLDLVDSIRKPGRRRALTLRRRGRSWEAERPAA